MITLHTTWNVAIDYPVFRQLLSKFKGEFEKVVVSLSDHKEGIDLTQEIKSVLIPEGVTVFDPPMLSAQDDWRDRAINMAYGSFVGDWILFMEQDFFFTPKFWERIKEMMSVYDCMAYYVEQRVHPAFILVKKSIVDKVKRDFSANPPQWDHFYIFTQSLIDKCKIIPLYWMSLQERRDYAHLTGLTHDYYRTKRGDAPIGTDNFKTYNEYATKVKPTIEKFNLQALEVLEKWGKGSDDNFLRPILNTLW